MGDVFVVASDERSARRIAGEPAVTVDGAKGAGVMRADLRTLLSGAQDALEIVPPRFGELVGSLDVSTERLRGRVRAELP